MWKTRLIAEVGEKLATSIGIEHERVLRRTAPSLQSGPFGERKLPDAHFETPRRGHPNCRELALAPVAVADGRHLVRPVANDDQNARSLQWIAWRLMPPAFPKIQGDNTWSGLVFAS
jgi:hypothetical protein